MGPSKPGLIPCSDAAGEIAAAGEARQAFEHLQAARHIGKIVIKVRG